MTEIIKNFPLWVQIALFSAPVIGSVVAGVGLMLNVGQSRRAGRQFKLALAAEAIQKFSSDDLMQKAFYQIEYSKFKYDSVHFHGSTLEVEIDRLLRHFATVAMFWKSSLLSVNDTLPIKYHVIRIVGDPEVRKYIDFVNSWAQMQNVEGHPYVALVELFEAYQ